jgi:hypothetical protein
VRWIFLLLSALAAEKVDLGQVNYALRLAPRFLKGEKPGHPKVPCLVTPEMAQSLSRAQDALRLRELFIRVLECGNDFVDVQLEDRSGLSPKTGPSDLNKAMVAEGWKADPATPKRFLR